MGKKMGGLQIPRWLGSDPLSAWWLGLAPATLEFWVRFPNESVCICLLLQDLLQRCSRGGRRRVEDMDYERRRAEACVDGTSGEPGTFTQGAPVFPGSSNTPWNWNRPNV